MLRVPLLTLLVALLLAAVFGVTGSRADLIESRLRAIHARHHLAERLSILLAEACARQDASDPACLPKGQRAAFTILGFKSSSELGPAERELVRAFRHAPRSLAALPAWEAFRPVWEADRADLAAFAADDKVLLGRDWSFGRAFWSFWEHGSLAHLLFDLLNLLIFGALVESLTGKLAWSAAYFGGGLFGSYVFATYFHHDLSVALGPSAGIYALMGAFVPACVRMIVLNPPPTFRRLVLWSLAAVYVVADLLIQTFALSREESPWALHLAGFAAGVLVGLAAGLLPPPVDRYAIRAPEAEAGDPA